ncbi:MAG: hypothetical protein WCJ30_24425, partial [Deltaproteobacteria bacterium]
SHPLLAAAAREEAGKAVADVELQTAAEVVVAVRGTCDPYAAADLLWGALASLVALSLLLYLPQHFPPFAFPLDSAAAFGLAAWASSRMPAMRRLLTTARDRDGRVKTAARAAFVDMGISRTTGRTGILIFVGVFEQRVEVVADIGVPVPSLGAAWTDGIAGMQRAVEGRGDHAAFFAAVRSLGPALASVLPRAEDDVNELPDGMAVS